MDSLRRYSLFCSWAIAAAIVAGMLGAFHPLADSFAHFRLHLLVLALPFLLLLLITRAWINALVLAAVIAVGIGSLGQLFGGGALASDAADEKSKLRIVSLNLHHFYSDPERIGAFMETSGADVVTLQEAGLKPPKVTERLREAFPHQLICRYRGDVGIAVLSRTPFTGTGCFNDQRLGWATVEKHGQQTTIASLHLKWPFPSPQAAQITGLSSVWSGLDSPMVITGDFNAAPWSHAVQRVADDSGTRVVPGLRRSFTWGDNWLGDLMALPIDHALVSPTLKVDKAELGPHVSSDHLPLIVDVEMSSF